MPKKASRRRVPSAAKTPRPVTRKEFDWGPRPAVWPDECEWPPSPEVLAEMIAYDEEQYATTKQPIFAWSACLTAYRAGLPLPPWVYKCFATIGENLRNACVQRPSKNRIASTIRAALGFRPGGVRARTEALRSVNDDTKFGAYNPFAAVRLDPARNIATYVFRERCFGASPAGAYAAVAREFGVSTRTVERAWAKYRDDFSRVS